jgi:hypothetical protein
MVDDRPEDTASSPDLGRSKRAPPTIDLEATQISGETKSAGAEAQPEPVSHEPSSQDSSSQDSLSHESLSHESSPQESPPQGPSSDAPAAATSPWLVAVVSGAVAASLVIGVGWMLGWPAIAPAPPAASQVTTAAIDGLSARIASVESKAGKAPAAAPDPAAAARVEALEKTLATLRGELAAARAQSEKLAATINDVKSSAGQAAAPVDLSPINERLAQIERATRAQTAEIAKESNRPVDDVPLRRIVAAALLDVLVRVGDPYPAALTAAKSFADNADTLKPLDGFAASGVPSTNALTRELLTLVPKLSPPMQENATTGAGVVERLQAGAAKLVRIERTDGASNDRGAVVARVTAAAVRNDFAEARRELKALPPADRAAAQAWLDKADARDAALAASRQFAADAMAALAKPRQ